MHDKCCLLIGRPFRDRVEEWPEIIEKSKPPAVLIRHRFVRLVE
jgi:hypothetical protein